jgi:hypothetical protein
MGSRSFFSSKSSVAFFTRSGVLRYRQHRAASPFRRRVLTVTEKAFGRGVLLDRPAELDILGARSLRGVYQDLAQKSAVTRCIKDGQTLTLTSPSTSPGPGASRSQAQSVGPDFSLDN